MKRTFLRGLLALAPLILCIAGCDETYSDAVQYTVRTDPVPLEKLGDEFPFPDQPGQFPILAIENFRDERNPYFAINQKKNLIDTRVFRDPHQVSDGVKQDIKKVLDKLFGTPAKPTVGGIDEESRKMLDLSDETLAKGSRYYRVHCVHCHGVTGDGRGPTARWVNPHPRDYRHGRFKFESVDQTSSEGQRPPSRDDLMRILEHGIEGTAMPTFALLAQGDREALVSYVIHLSLRGKAELDIFKLALDPKTLQPNLEEGETLETQTTKYYHKNNVDAWVASQSAGTRIQISPYPYTEAQFKDSVERGHKLFFAAPKELQLGNNVCVTCHKDFGRQSTFRFDDWGTFSKPNNLLLGVYRGGRRPVDIYHRIHSGIQPSGMIAFGKFLKADAKTGVDPLWDLVNFVQVLGNPTMREQLGILID